jgi:hypothetical protein
METAMRKIIMMAVAGFVWKKLRGRMFGPAAARRPR